MKINLNFVFKLIEFLANLTEIISNIQDMQ